MWKMKGKEDSQMKGRVSTIVLITLTILLAGCGPSPADGPSLAGTEWVLVALEGNPPLEGAAPSAAFSADQIEGSTGCNHYSGTVAVSGSDIAIGDVAHTEMACLDPEGAMDQEQAFLAALTSAASYRMNGEQLELLDETGSTILTFAPPSAVSAVTETPAPDPSAAATPVPPTPTAEPTEVPPPAFEPPAGFVPYQDAPTGISVYIPESWVVTGILPGEFAILQSYPEDKYVGGEAREPGDTKCDLNIRPPDVSLNDALQALQSDPMATILSEQEVVLLSGETGIRREVDSLGRSLSLYTEVNGQVVILICFGDFGLFDDIALTLGATE
jgi:heat shock protein HslJ